MSAQALATVMGPPLMLHSANAPNGSDVDHAQPIAVLKYLLQIWPQPQTATISGNVIFLLYSIHDEMNGISFMKCSTNCAAYLNGTIFIDCNTNHETLTKMLRFAFEKWSRLRIIYMV